MVAAGATQGKGRITRVSVTSGVGCGAVVRGRAHNWLRSSVGNGPVGIQFAARPAQHGGARFMGYALLIWGPKQTGGALAKGHSQTGPGHPRGQRLRGAKWPTTRPRGGQRLHGAQGHSICCCGGGVGWGLVVAGGVLPMAKGRPTRVAVVRGRAHKWLRSSVGNGPVGKYIAARPA